jgi:hypothetical protein
MILHCVFCNIRPDVTAPQRDPIIEGLRTLCQGMDGALGFDAGVNLDFEGKSPDHGYGFVIRFADKAAAMTYANDPEHQKLGAALCGICEGGADGIVVYDLSL